MRNFRRIALIAAVAAALFWWTRAAFPPASDVSAPAAGSGRTRDAAAVGAARDEPPVVRRGGGARSSARPLSASASHSDATRPPATEPAEPDRSELATAAAAIELEPLVPGEATAFAFGFDPDAPRPLLLWRRVGDRVAVMARGHSLADGSLDFPELVVPDAGLEVVVTAADDTPDGGSASLPQTLGARPLLRPRARVLRGPTGATSELTLRVVPAEASGVILVAAVGGEIFSRHPLPARPGAAERAFDLYVRVPDGDSHVWLAHERSDGRRSDWWPVALVPPAPGGQR